MFSTCFCTKRNIDVSLLLIRIGLAGIFIYHGITKFLALAMVIGWFESLGLPTLLGYLVPLLEIVGGLFIFLGVYVEVSAIILAVIMIFAIVLVKFRLGFASGWEYEGFLFMVLFSLAFSGPGRFSFSPCLNKCIWLKKLFPRFFLTAVRLKK